MDDGLTYFCQDCGRDVSILECSHFGEEDEEPP